MATTPILAAIATLHLSGGALALSPNLTIKQLHHTAWGPSQGAPLGGAVALEQTNDGYLWIAGLSARLVSLELTHHNGQLEGAFR